MNEMLTAIEQEGIKAILKRMSLEDLLSLTFTTTKGFVKPENQYEAVQAVLLYCDKPSLLLRRRKVKREHLFHYLKDVGITVSVSGEKREYIKACLKYWEGNEKNLDDASFDDVDEPNSSACHSPNSIPNLSGTKYGENNQFTHQNSAVVGSSLQQIPAWNQLDEFEIDIQACPPSMEIIALGKLFVEWFYRILNGNLEPNQSESLQSNHFWPDCSLHAHFLGNDHSSKANTLVGADTITNFFKCVLSANRLYMDPSLECIRTSLNSHGYVKVCVNGMVHQRPVVAGLFEQAFVLIKEPNANNTWRIKHSLIRIQFNCPLNSFLQTLAIQNVVF